jgi:hypothetical protein
MVCWWRQAVGSKYLVDVSAVQSDRVAGLSAHVPEGEELVGDLRGPGKLAGSREAQQQQVQYQAVVLRHKGRVLEAADQTCGQREPSAT